MRILIAGAGVAGLTTALSLHAAGLDDIRLVDAAPEIRPLGAGINLLPNAVRELADLGLDAAVSASAVSTTELVYFSRHGDVIWREPRGRAAGHRWPQLSVHRGRLQMVLLAAVQERLGGRCVRADARVTDFQVLPTGRVRVTLVHRTGGTTTTEADALVGADGIRSGVRRVLFPDEGPPVWQRQVVWRGIARIPPFADGRSMVVGGDSTWKVVAYPIAPQPDAAGLVETNWAVSRTFVPGEDVDRAGWDRVADPAKLLAALDGWVFGSLDVSALITAAKAPFEQAMVDRDPLPRWTFGPVTLVGDAAHAMCPMGSNGTTQAIVDARALASAVAGHPDVCTAFTAYERDRRDRMTLLQTCNRALGPEVVVAMADRSRSVTRPCPSASDPDHELAEVSRRYAELGGFDVATANAASRYSVRRRPRSTRPAGQQAAS
ncbi:3-hydroxybenzoate 6-hydroxylase 1 [Micromonospora sp. MH33]|uniref:FAD-dependent monooxygenase n=1 Tax=Micromonospora sp. MH33 TaxID=1945509 RepID=UPI000D149CD4|nr:FAD-dependent monooxygenase [Micromonospora sp. MH33]PSK66851.1 3-hydroxybenzoate 6-hydroxylase 1 [Micromonospora sp. MH33]